MKENVMDIQIVKGQWIVSTLMDGIIKN